MCWGRHRGHGHGGVPLSVCKGLTLSAGGYQCAAGTAARGLAWRAGGSLCAPPLTVAAMLSSTPPPALCSGDGGKGVGMAGGRAWTKNWLSFDNSYFTQVPSPLPYIRHCQHAHAHAHTRTHTHADAHAPSRPCQTRVSHRVPLIDCTKGSARSSLPALPFAGGSGRSCQCRRPCLPLIGTPPPCR